MKTDRNRIIALAGIYQAAALVSEIAARGKHEAGPEKASIFSLFQINADTVEDVFGGIQGIERGLREFYRQLDNSPNKDLNRIRYAIQMIQLDGILQKKTDMLETIGKGIADAVKRQEHFDMMHPNIIAHFAEIYSQTLSNLNPRIMVKGEALHLNNPDNANMIRALLLAGIRSARLWRQCGGNRLQFLFGRNKMMKITKDLLNELPDQQVLH